MSNKFPFCTWFIYSQIKEPGEFTLAGGCYDLTHSAYGDSCSKHQTTVPFILKEVSNNFLKHQKSIIARKVTESNVFTKQKLYIFFLKNNLKRKKIHLLIKQIFFFFFLLNFLGWHWLIKLYRFRVYNSTVHHLYIVLCDYYPQKNHFQRLKSQVRVSTFYFIREKKKGVKHEMVPLILTSFDLLHPAFLHLQIHLHNTEDQKVWKF